ncbi:MULTISPECIES: prepilin-type N-terminal cleavage/methylation domain-containing protein [Clostridium]|jgi:prepilin-type N-terminal cleavage/methylation domain-containing protein|uniref:prepilin-type N-terminal cleavage/methylation domain-containing protein n=1 Tax=Clostridium TaxID=1485 RepID=UPI000E54F083|nr:MULTISPECIES: prepilin-type N-terminal cleavage/methylation domain-containing protein [Clostridium]RGH12849.1 prepilin-type N-terminal cleavage/methylation domain-containing protein [Clostridium sp. AF12-41]RHS43279.1 prepilin-type N-terminal cleavage/methylation domain-containing protein [Clostridium sp. AF02-29]RHU45207.1 prepilin-type N-terminal cleavage/methylation domain-containing protein [Clostridium sp. TF11-13AC]
MKRREGFTLVELLIVVVIIGILVSISIPIFTAQMHKAKVAADWANLRAYYAEIQADYMSTQKQNPKVKVIDVAGSDYDWQSVTFLDGHKVKMKAGYCAVRFKKDKGYSIAYDCNKSHEKCKLGLGENYD